MQKTVQSLLAAIVATGALTATAFAQTAAPMDPAGKDTQKCVSADGKELKSADGKSISTKTECDKQGGKLEPSVKGQ